MAQQSGFSIPRFNDREVHNRMLKAAGEQGIRKFTITTVFGTTIEDVEGEKREQLKAVLDQETIGVQRFSFEFPDHMKVSVVRPSAKGGDVSGYQDRIELSYDVNQFKGNDTEWLTTLRNAYDAVDEKALTEYLAEEDRAFYQAREQSIRDLQGMQEQFFKQLQEFTTEQTKGYQSRLDELEAKAVETEEKREGILQNRLAEVTEKEEQLGKREKELDDRDNTTTRRSLLKDIQTILEERANKFELTKATRLRRWPALSGFLLLLVLLAGATGFFIYWDFQANKTGNLSAWLIVRQIVFGVAFAATAGFFLKWMSQWATRHAEEEFALKQLELDIIRASWVAEHALEWAESKHDEIPEDLIERLSRNLFTSRDQEGEEKTAAELLADALLGSAASANLKFGENEVTVDRKGFLKMRGKGTSSS